MRPVCTWERIETCQIGLYLKASLDETLKDGDWEAFWLAIDDMIEARQTTAAGVINGNVVDKSQQY